LQHYTVAYTKANLQHLHNIFGFKSVKLVKPKGKGLPGVQKKQIGMLNTISEKQIKKIN